MQKNVYQHTSLRLARGANRVGELAAHLRGDGLARLAEAGGSLYGLWAGQLGFASNEAVAMTVWPDAETARQHGEAALRSCAAVVAAAPEYLIPTLRPTDPTPPSGPGMFVFRWFDVEAAGVEEVIRLSGEAWQSFEANFAARILGLFRALEAEPGHTRLLLLTRYADYATWEASRSPDADPEAWRRFQRRHELTYSTVGRSAILVSS